jgi:2-methylisocitrate lyase-like PEP mutase family enzyme
MLEFGATPVLPPATLHAMGYSVAAYPVTLLSASIRAMTQTLQLIKDGQPTDSMILDFADLKETVGFNDYDSEMKFFRDKDWSRKE